MEDGQASSCERGHRGRVTAGSPCLRVRGHRRGGGGAPVGLLPGRARQAAAPESASSPASPPGRPIHRSTWALIWAPAARKAAIPKGTGLHSFRHYFATLLIHGGASVKRVQFALGHSTPTITLNTYVGEWSGRRPANAVHR